jgi:hypothetical protein
VAWFPGGDDPEACDGAPDEDPHGEGLEAAQQGIDVVSFLFLICLLFQGALIENLKRELTARTSRQGSHL